MINSLVARNLVKLAFPDRVRPGLLLMLKCYFDDSGTDAKSPALVWAGILGRAELIDKLDRDWRALLREPLPGKPPLEAFHLSSCAAAGGEFRTYSQAERDLTRRKFRQIIVESGAEGVGYAVSTKDYDELIQGAARDHYGTAEQCCVGGCIQYALERSAELGVKQVAIIFDEGRRTPEIQSILDRVKANYVGPAELVHIGFSPVTKFAPLQAADTLATETFWNAKDYLKGVTVLRPHFNDFLKQIVAKGFIRGRNEILADLAKFNRQ